MAQTKMNKFMTVYERPFDDNRGQDVLDIKRGFMENPSSNVNRIKKFFLENIDIEDSEIGIFIDNHQIISREEVVNVLNGKFSIKDLSREEKRVWLSFWNLLTKKMVLEIIEVDKKWKETNLKEEEKRVRATISYIVEQAIMGKEWKGQKPLPKKSLPLKESEPKSKKIDKPLQKELKEPDFEDLKHEILNVDESDLEKNKVLEEKISGLDEGNQTKFIKYLNDSFFEILDKDGHIDKNLTINRFGNESPLILLNTDNSSWTSLTEESSRLLMIEIREFQKKTKNLWESFEADIISSEKNEDEENAFTFYIEYEDLTDVQKKEFKDFYNKRLGEEAEKNDSDFFVFEDEDEGTLKFIESTRDLIENVDSTALPSFIEEYADCNLSDLRKIKGWINNIYSIESLILENDDYQASLKEQKRLIGELHETFSQDKEKHYQDKILKEIRQIGVKVESLKVKISKNNKKIKETRNFISKGVVAAARKNLRTIILNNKRHPERYSHSGVSSEMIESDISDIITRIEAWDPLKEGSLSKDFLKKIKVISHVVGERIGYQFEDTEPVSEEVKQLNINMRRGSKSNRVFDFDPNIAEKVIIKQPSGYYKKSFADQVRDQNHHSNYATFLLTLAQSRYYEGTNFRDKEEFMEVRDEFLDKIFDFGNQMNRQGKCMVLTAMMHYPDLTVWKNEEKWNNFRDSLFERCDYNEIELGSIIESIFYYGWQDMPKVKSFLKKYQSRWQAMARLEHLQQRDTSSDVIIDQIKKDSPSWVTSHEVYIDSASSFVDILIKTRDGQQLIVELDGGSHYYTDQNRNFILDTNGNLIERSKSKKKKRLLSRSNIPVLHISHAQNLVKQIRIDPDSEDIARGHESGSRFMDVLDKSAIRDILNAIHYKLAKP